MSRYSRTAMRVVTLNCFLNPRSLTAGVRLRLIARELKLMAADVVLLQEVILKRYRRWLTRYLTNLGYHCFSEEGRWFTRGGLLTAVRGAIESAKFTPFRNQGGLTGLIMGDAIMGKGYQQLEVTVTGRRCTFINSHLLAHYGRWSSLERNRNLADQVQELLVSVGAAGASNLVVGGDFNFLPNSKFYRMFTSALNLTDTLGEAAMNDGRGGRFATHAKDRLDYIFYRSNGLGRSQAALAFRTPLTWGKNRYRPSDHFGVMCEFIPA